MFRNTIEYKLTGDYALFTNPLTKTGGEKFSYPVPTYQALIGITEAIYWKPTFLWVIDECRIMNPIETESKGIRVMNYKNSSVGDLSYYTYLKNVEYRVRAHFEWNENMLNLAEDRNENKHYQMALRAVERGGRRDIFLGTRECPGYIEPCIFDEGVGAYDNQDMLFGLMLHGFTYPEGAIREEERGMLTRRLWNAEMKNGIINFPHPEECTLRNPIRRMKEKTFLKNVNFTTLESKAC